VLKPKKLNGQTGESKGSVGMWGKLGTYRTIGQVGEENWIIVRKGVIFLGPGGHWGGGGGGVVTGRREKN